MLYGIDVSRMDQKNHMLIVTSFTDGHAKALVGLAMIGAATCAYGAYKVGKRFVKKEDNHPNWK